MLLLARLSVRPPTGAEVRLSPIDLVFLLLFGGVIWFLLIKPQMDEKKAHDELVTSLAKDDRW